MCALCSSKESSRLTLARVRNALHVAYRPTISKPIRPMLKLPTSTAHRYQAVIVRIPFRCQTPTYPQTYPQIVDKWRHHATDGLTRFPYTTLSICPDICLPRLARACHSKRFHARTTHIPGMQGDTPHVTKPLHNDAVAEPLPNRYPKTLDKPRRGVYNRARAHPVGFPNLPSYEGHDIGPDFRK